jgi:hypothetical protein
MFGYETLTAVVRTEIPGVPDVLPARFNEIKQNVIVDRAKFRELPGNRKTARRQAYGGLARARTLSDVGERDVKLIHTREKLEIPAQVMHGLFQLESYNLDQEFEMVMEQIEFFREYFNNLRKTQKLQALVNGVNYFDADGNILPSSAGAVETTDFLIPAGNKNQLDVFGDGAIISASWATPSTDIPLQLRNLKKAAVAKSGYPLKYCFYGTNVLSYLINNNYVKDYLAREGNRRGEYLTDNEIGQLFGLTWVPIGDQFYEDSSGTIHYIAGADAAIFTPEPDKKWWQLFEGSMLVPKTIDLFPTLDSLKQNSELLYGMVGYSRINHETMQLESYTADTFLYTIKNPKVIFQADVTP